VMRSKERYALKKKFPRSQKDTTPMAIKKEKKKVAHTGCVNKRRKSLQVGFRRANSSDRGKGKPVETTSARKRKKRKRKKFFRKPITAPRR